MQAAGGINNQQIRALCLGGLDAVIDDRRGVSALGVLDNRHTRAFRPDGQLVSRRRTESIRRAEDNPAANVLKAQGELADGSRFARAVHADNEHDHRPAQRWTRDVHLLNHDIFEHLLGGIGILDLVFAHAAAQFIHNGGCRLHAAVGHEQDVFEFLIEVLVNLPCFLHQRIDAPHQRITRLGQSFTQFCKQSHRHSFFLRGTAP